MQRDKLFIYQLLPRLFSNGNSTNRFNGSIAENGCGKFNDITDDLLAQLKENGYTHVWYIGVLAHASATDYTHHGIPRQFPEIVKGKAGSPYAVRDYYDVDPDLSEVVPDRMKEFERLIRRTRKAGLKVIIDNVPNHVARNYQSIAKPEGVKDFGEDDDPSEAFSPRNNFYYLPGQPLEIQFSEEEREEKIYREYPAKATGNDCFTNGPTRYDWYETVKLNYGIDYMGGGVTHFDPIPDTWEKMKEIFLFWARKGVDGFRCDMAEMVPLAFWRWVIPRVKEHFPTILFVAEIYNPDAYRDFLGGDGFDYLYDKVGLYDTLRDVSSGNRPSSDISFVLNSVGDIQPRMLNFMENHDEQRIASDFFLKEGRKARAAMIVTACVNSNPVMIYAGQELGEKGMDEEGFSGKDGRTTIFDYWSPSTLRAWNNNGSWNEASLAPEAIELRDFYRDLIRLCNKEKALSNGLFYDLMPPNYENEAFDSTSLFAFLRGDKNSLLLIVTNFSSHEKTCEVRIPTHAYDFFEKAIGKSANLTLTPLLSRKGEPRVFPTDQPLKISLSPEEGEIYRISLI